MKAPFLLAAALALPVFGQPAQDQSLESKLSAVVGDYSLAGFGSPRTIAKLGSDFHLSMGIEMIARELRTPPQPSVWNLRGPWHGVTVAAILRDVVGQMPGLGTVTRPSSGFPDEATPPQYRRRVSAAAPLGQAWWTKAGLPGN